MPIRSSRPKVPAGLYAFAGATLLSLLENEAARREIRRRAADASDGLVNWAQERRRNWSTSRSTLNPIGAVRSRVGHQRLERRIGELFGVAPELDAVQPELAAELRATEGELRRAVTVTAQLSASKRLRARRDIYKRLDEIEERLVEAILTDATPPAEPTPH